MPTGLSISSPSASESGNAISSAAMRHAFTLPAAWLMVEAVIGSSTSKADAKPTEARECVAAHEDGQRARRDGHLREARRRFVACASEACPVDVRRDCSTQLDEVDAR